MGQSYNILRAGKEAGQKIFQRTMEQMGVDYTDADAMIEAANKHPKLFQSISLYSTRAMLIETIGSEAANRISDALAKKMGLGPISSMLLEKVTDESVDLISRRFAN